jgi:glycosyltransferase involved in cell wall biosynthesis
MERGLVIRMLEKLELFLYRRAQAIIPVTQSFKDDLISRGIDGVKITVVRNGVDLSRYHPRSKSNEMARELDVEGKFVVAYLGTHGMAHALENVLNAAKLLENHANICFLLVGDGARKQALREQARTMELTNVIFHDSVAKERMPSVWSVCDVALVHLKDDPAFAKVIPSKVFEAFGMAKPVMIVQPDGEAVDIIREAQAGEWIAPENADDLAQAILRWHASESTVRKLGQNALVAAQYHSRDRLAAEMLAALSTFS